MKQHILAIACVVGAYLGTAFFVKFDAQMLPLWLAPALLLWFTCAILIGIHENSTAMRLVLVFFVAMLGVLSAAIVSVAKGKSVVAQGALGVSGLFFALFILATFAVTRYLRTVRTAEVFGESAFVTHSLSMLELVLLATGLAFI